VKPQPRPNSIYKGFSQNEKCNVSANNNSHMPNTKVNLGIPPDATKHQRHNSFPVISRWKVDRSLFARVASDPAGLPEFETVTSWKYTLKNHFKPVELTH
jgi:hypothetical protein